MSDAALKPAEVCRRLGVSAATLRRLVVAGEIEAIAVVCAGRRPMYRFTPAMVERFLRQHSTRPRPERGVEPEPRPDLPGWYKGVLRRRRRVL